MNRLRQTVSSYPFSLAVIIIIWVLCLIPIPETPLNQISLIDKWTHFVMYGGLCTVVWAEYTLRHPQPSKRNRFLWTFVMPWAMGGLVELAQAYCTGGRRSGDIVDFIADGIGVVIGQLTGMLAARALSSWRKD